MKLNTYEHEIFQLAEEEIKRRDSTVACTLVFDPCRSVSIVFDRSHGAVFERRGKPIDGTLPVSCVDYVCVCTACSCNALCTGKPICPFENRESLASTDRCWRKTTITLICFLDLLPAQ